MGQSHRAFFDSTASLGDQQSLRAGMLENGYLYIRQLAPREPLLQLRRAILEICASAGWVDTSTDVMAGKWSGAGPCTEGDPQYMAVYKQIINHPLFISWPEQREIIDAIGKIVDAPVLAHRLRIGRVTFPDNVQQTTAAHQDFQYIRGSAQTYTIWTPIGDCPIELGGLAVLRGSHRAGFIEHQLFKEKKYAGQGLSETALPAGEGIEWHAGDFQAGDALIFHSHTVHKALPNLTKDRLRLSTDNRYQSAADQIAEISTKSHYGL